VKPTASLLALMTSTVTSLQQNLLLTSREYAQALDVSESSVKRWIDQGLIVATRTPGGHRRISAVEGVRFARSRGLVILRPKLLGFELTPSDPSSDRLVRTLAALTSGNSEAFRNIIESAYLAGESIAHIGDTLLAPALSALGELWCRDENGILIEHCATELVIAGLHALRRMIPEPSGTAKSAIGCSPEEDIYLIPSLLVSMVFKDRGYRVTNLGANLPLRALALGIEARKPKAVWVSFTSQRSGRSYNAALAELMAQPSQAHRAFFLGGVETPGRLKRQHQPNVHVLDTLGQLDAAIRGDAAQRRR